LIFLSISCRELSSTLLGTKGAKALKSLKTPERLGFSTSGCYKRSKDEVAMCTYLHGPRDGGMYYFRRGIPARLRSIIGGREFFFSLGVKDREQAKRLIPAHTAATQRKLDQAQAEIDGKTRGDVGTGAKAAVSEHMTREEADWHRDSEAFFSKLVAAEDWEAEDADAYERRLHDPAADLTPDEMLAARLLREAQDVAKGYRRRYRRRKQSDEQSSNGKAPLTEVRRSNPSATIIALFEGYAKQPGIRPETIKQFGAIIRHLIKFLGHDDAAAVTPQDLVRWRNFLEREPLLAGRFRSPKTINGSYMAAVKVVFGFGVNQLLLPSNPMGDVAKVRAERKVKLREKDFTRAEQRTILNAALLKPEGRLSETRGAALRWVPWLCAYTGARVNEMTQLRAEDVKQIDGIWAIHITPEAGGVKTDAARYVPLHEHLIEQGFLSFVAGKAGPIFYDPAAARREGGAARGQYKKVGMFLAAWVRELGITDPTLKPNHAWRHTFKTICTEAGIEERAADAMQGHASKGVGRSYGSNSMAALSAQIAKFPRFRLITD
jgi:integrase